MHIRILSLPIVVETKRAIIGCNYVVCLKHIIDAEFVGGIDTDGKKRSISTTVSAIRLAVNTTITCKGPRHQDIITRTDTAARHELSQ